MSQSIKITTKDICAALDIGRHQLRSWTDILTPFSKRITKERSACRYDFGDLLFLAVIKHIHCSLGISLPFIAEFSESLYDCIREPQDIAASPFVFINIREKNCVRMLSDKILHEGILVDLLPAQEQVYKFLGISAQQQAQLQLGLVKVN